MPRLPGTTAAPCAALSALKMPGLDLTVTKAEWFAAGHRCLRRAPALRRRSSSCRPPVGLTGCWTAGPAATASRTASGSRWRFPPSEVSPEALSKALVEAGLPQPIAELLAAFDVNTKLGRASQVSDDVQRLTGRPHSPCETSCPVAMHRP